MSDISDNRPVPELTARGVRMMFDVYMIESDSLMVGRPRGVLDAREATRIVEFIEIKEVESRGAFNRFCDLTRLDGIELSSTDVSELAARRQKFNPNNVRVKSAFLATHPLALGIACLYEHLLDSPRIEVRIFTEVEAAAEWLAVKPDVLNL